MKVAPVIEALKRYKHVHQVLVHSGQHYDDSMSRAFFEDLGLPEPDVNLEVGSGTHAWQTARVMLALEPVVGEVDPDIVLVVGDVNSTLAAALVAAKLGIPVAHVEAGLRSFDWSMPEEVNRVVTDRLSTYLFTTEPSANDNLRREGVPEERIYFVGNTMIDTLDRHLEAARALNAPARYGVSQREYALATLHRPANVDEPGALAAIAAALSKIAESIPVLFPAHPRTVDSIERFGLGSAFGRTQVLSPRPYLEFLALMADARVVLTDSGGVQEETTALGVPCLTLRPNTERPVTVTAGSNRLVRVETRAIVDEALKARHHSVIRRPERWDGRAAERTALVLAKGEPASF